MGHKAGIGSNAAKSVAGRLMATSASPASSADVHLEIFGQPADDDLLDRVGVVVPTTPIISASFEGDLVGGRIISGHLVRTRAGFMIHQIGMAPVAVFFVGFADGRVDDVVAPDAAESVDEITKRCAQGELNGRVIHFFEFGDPVGRNSVRAQIEGFGAFIGVNDRVGIDRAAIVEGGCGVILMV